jgi:hypothetical protein
VYTLLIFECKLQRKMKFIRIMCFATGVMGSFIILVLSAHSENRPLPELVNVKAIVHQEGDRLVLLVRLPLNSVRDIQFPSRGDSGYLDLSALKSMLPGAARYWIADCFELYEDGLLAPKPEIAQTRISLNADQSFNSYREAVDHFNSTDLPPDADVLAGQVWFDIRLEYSLHSNRPLLAIRPRVAGLGVRVSSALEYVELSGSVRGFSFEGDPGLIHLDPRPGDAGTQFLGWGFRYVLRTTDFLLFLFCLALTLHRYDQISPAVAAFISALSLALLASASGLAPDAVWFHPLIETLSAVSIIWIALGNIVGRVTPRGRAELALGTGFVYGFNCQFELGSKLQFGGSHVVVSAIAFAAGVAVAVALVSALLVPVFSFLYRFARTERVEMMVVSALAADTAWGWLEERWRLLSKVPLHAPTFDADLLVLVLRCLSILVLLGGLLWFGDGWLKSRHLPSGDLSTKKKSGDAI